MMHACVEVTRPHGVKTLVSLNTIMVDGTGMCGSCRATIGGEVKFACVDGPDFDGHLVDFGELALQPHQTRMQERDAFERAGNFKEVNLGYALQDALQEAERCIQCAIPTCIAGCPVAIDIPRFIRHLLVRDLEGALATIHEASIFPSVCGRVCPQETQCEAQCIIGKKMEPVAIGRLERFVGDNARPAPVRAPRFQPVDKLGRVAICGSGPSGLAAAADLPRYGCDVTVFEALHVAGGVLRYGIPAFRLPRDIIDRALKRLTDLGVHVETNKVIGKTLTVPQLLGELGFDALFVGVGAGSPAFLGIPGEFAGQVYSANEFLTRVNLMGGDQFPLRDTPINVGKSVVVIGAGNTAMDCLRVARRLGVPAVRCVYRRGEAEAPFRELRRDTRRPGRFAIAAQPRATLCKSCARARELALAPGCYLCEARVSHRLPIRHVEPGDIMPRTFVVTFALALACAKQPVPNEPAIAAASAVAPTLSAAAPDGSAMSGKVVEKIDASQYSYLRMITPSGEVWAAVPKSTIAVGAQATVVGANWMEDFTSATLSRTWPRIAFGTLAGEAAPPREPAPSAKPGHAGAGMFAQQAAQAFPSQPQAEVQDGPALHKVATREGRTIAEVYAQKVALKDKRVAVRGKVVKAVSGVMGKNWLHLKDGTGTGPSADLAVTTDGTAKVGDVVVVTGTVHLDRDLGSGYRYDILVEDAQLQKE